MGSAAGYLDLVRGMVEREKVYAEAIASLGGRVRHPVLKAIFTAVSSDSLKHSKLYEAVVELLTEAQPMVSEEEFKAIQREIDRHIETERQMIEIVEEIIRSVDDPRLKLILSAILVDEVHHHRILVDIRDKLAEIETLKEEDLWNAIWRDSPWHGTPGG